MTLTLILWDLHTQHILKNGMKSKGLVADGGRTAPAEIHIVKRNLTLYWEQAHENCKVEVHKKTKGLDLFVKSI